MDSTRDLYIQLYHRQKEELIEKDEAWCLRHQTEESFLNELDEIQDRYLHHSFLNDFHRESSTNTALSILFQNILSVNEMKEQMDRFRRVREKK